MLNKGYLKWKNEEGTTLVELLAAVAILSIIVTAFLAFFIQAASTNNRTNHVNEATFIAQEKLEEATNLASKGELKVDERDEVINNYQVKTIISEIEDSNLLKVVVEVHGEGEKQRAKMETRVPVTEAPSD